MLNKKIFNYVVIEFLIGDKYIKDIEIKIWGVENICY